MRCSRCSRTAWRRDERHRRLSRPCGKSQRRGRLGARARCGSVARAAELLGGDQRGDERGRRDRRPADRELARRADRRDARPPLRLGALDRARGDASDPPLRPRPPRARRSRRRRRSARIRPPSTSVANCSAPATFAASRRPRQPTRRASSPRPAIQAQVAIASAEAAAAYGLDVIVDDVGDRPGAFTRFVALAPYTQLAGGDGWRTALWFVTDHQPGALYRALGPLARNGVNLVQLVSRPLPNSSWRYRFDVVLDGHIFDAAVRPALAELRAQTRDLRALRLLRGGDQAMSGDDALPQALGRARRRGAGRRSGASLHRPASRARGDEPAGLRRAARRRAAASAGPT